MAIWKILPPNIFNIIMLWHLSFWLMDWEKVMMIFFDNISEYIHTPSVLEAEIWKEQPSWLSTPIFTWQISKRFPELHPILDIANNQSLVFLNGHFSFSDIVPILPNQIEVGCMHCRPGNPLPEVSYKIHNKNISILVSIYTSDIYIISAKC